MGPRVSAHRRARDGTRRHPVARRDHRARVRHPIDRRRGRCDAPDPHGRDGLPRRRSGIGAVDRGSRMTLLVAYARERLTPSRVLPAVLLVVVAVLGGGGWPGTSAFETDLVLTLALVITFRIWDDLMDRDRDRTRHPERVLVRASSTNPVVIA